MGGVVVGWDEVGGGARGVARLADGGRAVTARLAGLDGEAELGELGVGSHVDVGKIPVDRIAADGVLELQHVRLVGAGGNLEGDTAAARRCLPVFGVGATVGADRVHVVVGAAADGPDVHVLVQVVPELHSAVAAAAAAAGSRAWAGRRRGGFADGAASTRAMGGVRDGRSESCEGGRKAEGFGEHHFVFRREW